MLYENTITVIKDALKYRKLLLAFFVISSFVGLGLGLNWPKFYTSSGTIFIQEENILGPLMQGAAVQTEVLDRAKIAREIVYGRDILLKILADGSWLNEEMTPVEKEWILDGLRSRLTIKNDRKNLIRFSYKDTEPERAFATITQILNLFISESLATKLGESRSAFEFIDKQVKEYHTKLRQAEEELKVFRSKNVDVRSGTAQEIATRIQELQTRVADISQELREEKIKKETLLAQLSGEAVTAAGLSRTEEYRTRIIELQSQLDTLLLNYHETYPDVVRARAQIADLKRALNQEEVDKLKGSPGNTITIEGVVVDERIQASPVYQQLRTDLYTTNSSIKTLTSRLADARRTLDELAELGRRSHELQASLAELERDYEVNSDIYQDFLRRREAARVSMNVDLDQKGLNLRIDEAPFLPLSPSGLGLLHFMIAGMLIGVLLPVGALFGILKFDPRIRTMNQLQQLTDIPIIGTVNEYYVDAAILETRNSYILVVALGLLTIVAVVVVALIFR